MIAINDEMKKQMSQYLDSDGKIMITDDMPDDLKSAINYINANNINVLDGSTPYADGIATDDSIENDEMDENASFSLNTTSSIDDTVANINISEDENIETDDLESLF